MDIKKFKSFFKWCAIVNGILQLGLLFVPRIVQNFLADLQCDSIHGSGDHR